MEDQDTRRDKLKYAIWYFWHVTVLSKLPYWLAHPINYYRDHKIINEFPVGTLIEDCNYHACVIISTDNFGDGDIECISLFTGGISSCSLFHCGIQKLTIEQVVARIDLYHEQGIAAVIDLAVAEYKKTSNYKKEKLRNGAAD